MKPSEIKIGQRIRVTTNGLNAFVTGKPEHWTRSDIKLVPIKYEKSTRYERMISTLIELLPTEEQFPAHGGTFQRPAGIF